MQGININRFVVHLSHFSFKSLKSLLKLFLPGVCFHQVIFENGSQVGVVQDIFFDLLQMLADLVQFSDKSPLFFHNRNIGI